jgi:hypothetical protein
MCSSSVVPSGLLTSVISQVLQQWTCLVADLSLTLNLCSSPPRVQSPADLQHYVDDDYSEDYIPPSSKRKPRPRYALSYCFPMIHRVSSTTFMRTGDTYCFQLFSFPALELKILSLHLSVNC